MTPHLGLTVSFTPMQPAGSKPGMWEFCFCASLGG
jgi:hypothetical protein